MFPRTLSTKNKSIWYWGGILRTGGGNVYQNHFLVPCGDGSTAFPQKPDSTISVKVEFGEEEGKVPLDNIAKRAETYKSKERVTYKMIQ